MAESLIGLLRNRQLDEHAPRLSTGEAVGEAIVAGRLRDSGMAAKFFDIAIPDDPRAPLESAQNKLWLEEGRARARTACSLRMPRCFWNA